MKLAINATYNPSGGSKTQLVNMLKNFLNVKDISFVIFIRKKNLDLLDDLDQNKIKVVVSRVAGISTILRVIWEQTVLPFLLIKEKAVILFCPGNIAPIYSPVKTIQWIGTIGPFFKEFYNGHNTYERIALHVNKYLMYMSARRSDIVIHESRFSQNLFYDKYDCSLSNSEVIHIGQDSSFYPVSSEKSKHINEKYKLNDPYILCVTKFLPYKNIDRLIEAFNKVTEIDNNIELVIIGKLYPHKKYSKEIIRKIELLGLNDKNTIIDEIPRPDLLFLYSRCNFLIFTSLYESIGYILMEAMSCGAAICCSNATAVPEACKNAALYFDPYNTLDIANKMKRIIKDDTFRKSLKMESLKRANELHDYEQVTMKVISIIRDTI